MYITKTLAEQMESCIKQTHIQVTQQYAQGRVLEVNGGAACFSGFDSYLSQVVGFGFSSKPKHFKSDIETFERFYKKLKHPRVDVELCPFVGNHLPEFLSQRDYTITELNNVSCIDLHEQQFVWPKEGEFIIREIDSNELDAWAKSVAIGFGVRDAQNQFFQYAKAPCVTAFAVYDKGAIVAGGTVAMQGTVCDLGVTSTLPTYRGRGLQKYLLAARLFHAQERGVSLATVTTVPGSISDLNIQKIGFRCAYTRVKMTRLFKNIGTPGE